MNDMDTVIHTTDNSAHDLTNEQCEALKPMVSKTLEDLNRSEHILVYPQNFERKDGNIGSQRVFEIVSD